MKKMNSLIVLSIGISLFFTNVATAQTPLKERKSLIVEFTETWCVNCGTWGWELAHELSEGLEEKGFILSMAGSSDPAHMNFQYADAMYSNYPGFGGVPTFMTNNQDAGTIFGPVMSQVNTFNAKEVIVSSAANITIENDTIKAVVKSKFWTGTSGDYYMNILVTEKDVSADQYPISGIAIHQNVTRTEMARTSDAKGKLTGSGTTAEGQEFENHFAIPVNPIWNLDNLNFYVVDFKAVGTKFEIVNTSKAVYDNTPSSIESIALSNKVNVYPNPVSDNLNISFKDLQSNTFNYRILDISGREILKGNISVLGNNDTKVINVNSLNSGNYIIEFVSNDVKFSKQLVKN